MNTIKLILVAALLGGCAAVRPVVDGADSVCAVALAEHELVQAAAVEYGCALMQRSADPADAAVAVARDGGLL